MSTTTLPTVTIAGKPLSLKPVDTRNGKTFYLVYKNGSSPFAAAKYGVQIPALKSDLPTAVDFQYGSYKASVPVKPVEATHGRPKVGGQHNFDMDGAAKTLSVSISETKAGNWNLLVKAFGAGGGGGSRVTDLDDLL